MQVDINNIVIAAQHCRDLERALNGLHDWTELLYSGKKVTDDDVEQIKKAVRRIATTSKALGNEISLLEMDTEDDPLAGYKESLSGAGKKVRNQCTHGSRNHGGD
jgi:hypothetical protein